MSPTKLPEWSAFQAAIVANPDDDTVRLVAADFLEENGDADRAAFIRIQVQLAQLVTHPEVETPEINQLRAKERAFLGPLSMFRMLWAAEACPELVKMSARGGGRDPLEATTVDGVDRLRWHRGFVFWVRCSARDWQKHGVAIRKRLPVEHLSLTECDDLTVPDWLGMVPTLLGLRQLKYGWSPELSRLEWLRSILPGVNVIPLAF